MIANVLVLSTLLGYTTPCFLDLQEDYFLSSPTPQFKSINSSALSLKRNKNFVMQKRSDVYKKEGVSEPT